MSTSWPSCLLAALVALSACSCDALQLASSPAALRRPCAQRASAPRMEVEVTALGNNLIVELTVEPATSAGGVFLPTAFDKEETVGGFQRKTINSGTVLSVGPGLTLEDGTVQPIAGISVGQTVVLEPNAQGMKVNAEDSDNQVFIFPHRRWSIVWVTPTMPAGRSHAPFLPASPATDRVHMHLVPCRVSAIHAVA